MSKEAKMQNDAGEHVDLYVPRKCSASSRIISAKDHAAIQIDFVEVDPQTGRLIPGMLLTTILTKFNYFS